MAIKSDSKKVLYAELGVDALIAIRNFFAAQLTTSLAMISEDMHSPINTSGHDDRART